MINLKKNPFETKKEQSRRTTTGTTNNNNTKARAVNIGKTMALMIAAIAAVSAVAVFTPLGHVQKAAAYTTADCQAEYGQNFVIDSTGTTCEPSGYNNPEPDDGRHPMY